MGEKRGETGKLEFDFNTAWAHEIQMNLLPKSLPKYNDLDVAATLIPAREVGGDYYNVLKLNDQYSLLAIADVSGKGIPAALIVSVIYSSLITQIHECKSEVYIVSLVETLNKVLIEATTTDRFATAWIGLYEHSTKKLYGINAGHNYPFIFRKGETKPFELTKGGIMLGSIELPFDEEALTLRRGDILVLYTDGVTEAWNKMEEEYGEVRLIELVNSFGELSSQEIIERLFYDIRQHVGEAQPSDDITCVVMKVK
jgi:sigma-B regulation protein RsbU (phosphoserine phosphatase)